MVGIPVPIDASSINRRLSAIEASIRTMQGARSLTAATISEGGLTIRDGGDLTVRDGGGLTIRDGGDLTVRDGGEIAVHYREQDGAGDAALIGDIYGAESGTYMGTGLLVQRADGKDILAAYADPATNRQTLVIRDANESAVIHVSGTTRGLDAPTFSPHRSSTDYTTWGGIDGTAWESVMEGGTRLYSARIRAQARATADTPGATGNVRLMVSYAGTDYQIGATAAIGFGIAAPLWEADLPAAIPISGYFVIKMQAQRTAGTGKIRGTVTQLLLGP